MLPALGTPRRRHPEPRSPARRRPRRRPRQARATTGLQRPEGPQPGSGAGIQTRLSCRDRAYNNSEPAKWQLPIRAMGYKPVYDYRADQLGKQDGSQGAILVGGRWYCPSMPEPLISATIDLHAERIDRQTWVRLIAARRGYRLIPKQNADADGYPRVMCPAEAARPSAPSSPAPWAAASISPLSTRSPAQWARPLPPARHHRATTATPRTHWPRASKPRAPAASGASRPRRSSWPSTSPTPTAEGSGKWLETLALGGERALRRTHHRRKIKEPGTWTPTGHLSSAA